MEPITGLFTVLISIVTSAVMAVIKTIAPIVAQAPKPVRAVVVGLLAAPVAVLSGKVGIELPADPSTWDGTAVNAVLMWLMAMGAHAATKTLKRE